MFKYQKLKNNAFIQMYIVWQLKIKIYQRASGLLSSIGVEIPWIKILLIGPILSQCKI